MAEKWKAYESKSKTDFIIIGSGVAGLFTAICLAAKGRVTVISKQNLIAGNTWFAQGGIAASFSIDDSPALHFNDTWQAGSCFGQRKAIAALVEEAPKRIDDLIALGVRFDTTEGKIALGREGAHSVKRILHIGGDATGKKLVQALLLSAKSRDVNFIEDAFAEKLIVSDGRCCGLIYSHKKKLNCITAKAVILATGGCGQLFQYTTNAPAVTGDGLALAYNAGAVLRDLEFFQFHPTVFLPPQDQPFLISEAVRGEGAYLVNSSGKRFMKYYHSQGELGPRDIVSRAIMEEQLNTGDSIYLDLRHLSAGFISTRFPNIYKHCLDWGYNLTKQLIPVTPAAHYLIGGVEVDLNGHTAVNNLYAVGEIASTGVHGANRLASNSLLEGLVFGYRVAQSAANGSNQIENNAQIDSSSYGSNQASSAAIKTIKALRKTLPQLMWNKVGLTRNEQNLLEMRTHLTKWLPLLSYRYSEPELIEAANMLLIAAMMTEAALLRKESRGCHYRSDYPPANQSLAAKQITFQGSTVNSSSIKHYPGAKLVDKPTG